MLQTHTVLILISLYKMGVNYYTDLHLHSCNGVVTDRFRAMGKTYFMFYWWIESSLYYKRGLRRHILNTTQHFKQAFFDVRFFNNINHAKQQNRHRPKTPFEQTVAFYCISPHLLHQKAIPFTGI